MRAPEIPAAPARLLPSGDGIPVPDKLPSASCWCRARISAKRLWTSRVWPGALLVDGEIRGTWRRSQHTVRVEPWGRLSLKAREAVEVEA